MDRKDIFEDVNDRKDAFNYRVRSTVSDIFPLIVLTLNVVLAVALRLFNTWLDNPFTPEFFITLIYNVFSTMFCYSFFTYYADNKERARIPGFAENCKIWETLSSVVRLNWCEEFIEYCRAQVDIEREEKRRNIIANNTMITLSEYESTYRGKSNEEIWAMAKEGKISKKDAFYICRANGKIKIKPIYPLVILCGLSYDHPNDAGRKRMSYSTFSVLSRPILMFIGSAAITACKGTFVGLTGSDAFYDMLITTALIVSSSFLGYFAGAKSAKTENERVKSRIFFLERFKNAYEKTPEA